MAENEEYLAFDPAVRPDLNDIYDRSKVSVPRERVLIRERKFAQGGEINEAFSIESRKRTNIGNLVAHDGDRVKGCDIILDPFTGDSTLAAGEVYVRGDVRPVDAATFAGLPILGDVVVGVRVLSDIITHEEDPSLLGLHEEAIRSYGEPGAVREELSLTWGWDGDGEDGDLYRVYQIRDGFVVDQTAPPSLSGFNQALAVYDYDAHENYIARGCRVTPLGLSAGKQWFSIEEGTANILGFKRTRNTATRYGETEAPDILNIASEPHTFDDGGTGTAVITLNRTPINSVSSVIITKEVTETIPRGAVANTTDLLGHPGVVSISQVVQGATTYDVTADYILTGDRVDWAPGGIEPAGGSSYDVTYRYLDDVVPSAVGPKALTVAGGVTGGAVFVSYNYSLPRHDLICLDRNGLIVYLKGIPAVEQPQPPAAPATLLPLCVVENDWFGTPVVINNGIRSYPFWQIDRMYNKLVDTIGLVALARLQLDISAREPVAKKGVFVDPFNSDRYRDAGEAQNGAVFNGSFQIPIVPTFNELSLAAPVCLNFSEEVVVAQEAVTGCTKINPYQAFAPLPAKMRLTPSQDFWTETQDVWLSPDTQVFGQGNRSRVTEVEVVTSTREVTARFLRQISVAFVIDGFGPGETLSSLLFDGIAVTPAGPLVGDANGRVEGSFVIPANVAAGSKLVDATGGSGATAEASFIGQGRIDINTNQQVTTVQRFQEAPARGGRGGEGGGRGSPDPVAQSFQFTEGRHVSSIEVKFCVLGDVSQPVLCELVTMDNGYPTVDVIAQTETDMNTALVGAWHKFSFNPPVFIPAGVETAFVLKTNDPDHSVSFAARGGFDAARQEWIGAQPYTVGVRFSSSNASTWTAHQDEDLTCRINGAKFAPVTKTVALGTFPAVDMSDFIAEAQVFLPTGDTRMLFEVEPEGEQPVRIEPGQVWERQGFFSGLVALRAILTGTEKVSPVMGRDVLAIAGKMQATGVYVSRAMPMGTAIRLDAVMKTKLPSGSTLVVENDAADDVWQVLPQVAVEALSDGTFERTYSDAAYTAVQGRLRLTLTGTPAARPSVSDFRSFSI
ncbi:DUF4815 domain-containing protein [Mesorhizobium sp. M6A.T.Cr.TU.016.01.1.1]|uniref:DUF4815 domain-containing protein n=1 Tax=Mesorhizobium sp. M6A.T.Cr.TU.016.01.1.1 TaxID=2493677 RepID=UPI000F756574|nr:DUF4815 domain-containing protein [Mesorhizobium sp. M6A.T.Cr.TU.016.01.1.1]AZO67695.1 DUF4815 domain-containing protein [Mesorhizobium sp. M6A.T.Cr.TU.016.01.1.1]